MNEKQLPLNPTIDPIRTFQGVCTFDIFNGRHLVPIPNSDHARLVEAYLSFFAVPAQVAQNQPQDSFGGVDDLHVYLRFNSSSQARTLDLTQAIVAQLQSALSKAGASASEGLRQGTEDRLRLIERLQLTFTKELFAKMRTNVDALVKQEPSKWITRLGDREPDTWNGTLHPINFIYSYIPLAPISINKALIDVQQPRDRILLTEMTNVELVFSHGDMAASGRASFPCGRVSYCVECVYHSELLDEFKSLEGEIEQQLKEMHEQLATDGPIVHTLTLAQGVLGDALKELKDIQEIADDQKLQMQSIARTAAQLQQRLDSITAMLVKFDKKNVQVP